MHARHSRGEGNQLACDRSAHRRFLPLPVLAVAVVAAISCGEPSDGTQAGSDAATAAGSDASSFIPADAESVEPSDGGTTSTDGGANPDAGGSTDAASSADAGVDAGSSADVGFDAGTLAAWEVHRKPDYNLYGVWGSGSGEMWEGGINILQRWNGQAFQVSASGFGTGYYGQMWGSGPSDIWAAFGAVPTSLKHWNGTSWSSVSTPSANSVYSFCGLAANDVWGVGSDVLHWNGTRWTVALPGSSSDCTALSANDVWVVGGRSTKRWNGTSFVAVTNPSQFTSNNLTTVWASGPNDAWAAGTGGYLLRWNGSTWSSVPSGINADFKYIRGSGPNDVWAAYSSPSTSGALHWDGTAWSKTQSPPIDAGNSGKDGVYALWVGGPGDAWVVTYFGKQYHWDGTRWSNPWPSIFGSDSYRLRGRTSTDIWGTGTSGHIVHYDGRDWVQSDIYLNGAFVSDSFYDVWPNTASDVWVVGVSARHWDGTAWTLFPKGTSKTLNAVWGSAGNDVWAVGTGGAIVHWNGAAWIADTSQATTSDLYAIWGAAANDVWAAGAGGALVHFNGTAWSSVPSGTTVRLLSVSGTSASDVWLTGGDFGPGELLHWDGRAWTKLGSATDAVRQVWANTATDAWAVGGNSILHWDGTAWRVVSTYASDYLHGIWGASSTDLWATGGNGLLLRHR